MAIIVGDIHGNVEKVQVFLGYKPDVLHVALGDYVDSFAESPNRQAECLRLLLESKAVLLWGNHDIGYLKHPPFYCTGFQEKEYLRYQVLIELHKKRFLAAYAVDGWLCTHAGAHEGLVTTTDIYALAEKLNSDLAETLRSTRVLPPDNLFGVGRGRGGVSKHGGIFWYDFKREDGLATNINQIFGHTEIREPIVEKTYVALDTTNCDHTCYLFDTETNKIVKLKLPLRTIRSEMNLDDENIIVAGKVTLEMIEECRAGLKILKN